MTQLSPEQINVKVYQAIVELRTLWNEHIYDEALCRVVVSRVLDDPKFALAPGGATRHHSYEGGLAVHTLEVTRAALNILDNEIVCAAAICHDYAKIWSYEKRIKPHKCTLGDKLQIVTVVGDSCSLCGAQLVEFVKLPFEREVGHVVESWRLFMAQGEAEGLSGDLLQKVGHAMLAHHGRREWGSPVEPRTAEAWALHAADMMSMQAAGGEDKK